jgi:hypothetical protein
MGLQEKSLKPIIGAKYTLIDAIKAHPAPFMRLPIGKMILVPNILKKCMPNQALHPIPVPGKIP